jgi:hypothetical protein
MNMEALSDRELLSTYAKVMDLLRARGVVRSANNPVADYAETLVARTLGLTLTSKSTKSHDGLTPDGRRIEIKARRLSGHNASRQLSSLRALPDQGFDALAGVLFHADFRIMKACLIPHAQIVENSTFVSHTNSWRFLLRDGIWLVPGVEDITEQLIRAQS